MLIPIKLAMKTEHMFLHKGTDLVLFVISETISDWNIY